MSIKAIPSEKIQLTEAYSQTLAKNGVIIIKIEFLSWPDAVFLIGRQAQNCGPK